MLLARREIRAIGDITALMMTVEDDPRPILEQIGPQVQELLRAEVVSSYRVSPVEGARHWSVDFMNVTMGAPLLRDAFSNFLVGGEERHEFRYDPLAPGPRDRNIVRRPAAEMQEGAFREMPVNREVFVPLGLDRHDQLRVLLCDGPLLMAWFGGLRREPFTRREETILAKLTAPLAARVRLERRLLREGFLERALIAAMSATSIPVALCTLDGDIAFASSAARSRIDRDGRWRETLRSALRGASVPGVGCTRIRHPGVPEHVLVTFHEDPQNPDFDARLRFAGRAWGLTPRQSEVLGHVLLGESNKEVAERLACRENTVEVHVSAIFRKANVAGRPTLAARFWTMESTH
jgi:DNA-binding CsgD family transcriptional regulator